ncbi:MAG: ATP-binding protein [Chloroflexi bacterium]|nr:ATP-binding protein [Chloroflexota bacterium]
MTQRVVRNPNWQTENDQYLAAGLAWLRLRLTQQAEQHQNSQSLTEGEVAQAWELFAAGESLESPPALVLLSRQFGISPFEQQVLLLCAAMELDTRIAGLCARAQGNPQRPYPTFALALTLFAEPAWDVLSPERPLRRWRLIEINQPVSQPLTTSPLQADERIVNFLKGLNYLDDRLTPFLTLLETGDEFIELPPSQETIVDNIVQCCLSPERRRPSLASIQLLGADTASKQLVAHRAAAAMGLSLYRLPVDLLPRQAAELNTLARLWARDTRLMPVALYLDAHDAGSELTADGLASSLTRFMAGCEGLLFLDVRDVKPGLGRAALTLDVTKPTAVEQQTVWRESAGTLPPEGAELLSGQFNLGLPAIRQVTASVLDDRSVNGRNLSDSLWQACLAHTRPGLDTLAQRLIPKVTWDDIVLPEHELALLGQIADQIGQRSRVYDAWGFRQRMSRGLGIVTLFAGESGTGKTMAAEVLANDLRLNLYRIDLSGVVSKYVGETEKNLRRLFDAAEDGGAILFFDEADALFGKRSAVRDSHDRYANIEINYLLQRMEGYRGLAILATNRKSDLDEAFTRRLRFIINFPFPDPADRQRIWQRIFPPQTPRGELDYDRLARFKMTGGSIHNVALNAAFLAARSNGQVIMPLILKAIRTELLKSDRLVNEADFEWEGVE